jgi:hypothetical protein
MSVCLKARSARSRTTAKGSGRTPARETRDNLKDINIGVTSESEIRRNNMNVPKDTTAKDTRDNFETPDTAEDVTHRPQGAARVNKTTKPLPERTRKVWLISIWPLLCFKYSSFEK